ncbi:MAG: hypothetical protein D6681_05570 [Calditrichaeota bacterium]|nr:MAG: hypothetical protein D6681_05570 [Calditrichota bacterium]
MNRRLLELASLFELSQLLNESLELSRVLNNLLLIPMGRMMISRGAILLHRDGAYRVVMSKGLPPSLRQGSFSLDHFPDTPLCFPPSSQTTETFPAPLIEFARKARLKVAIPFRSNNRNLGMLMFGSKLDGSEFGEEELDYLNSLANIAATTINNALQLEEIRQINRQLDRKIQALETLFDVGQGLSATLDAGQILKLLTYTLMGQMMVTRHAILLQNGENREFPHCKGFEAPALKEVADCLGNTAVPLRAVRPTDLADSRTAARLQQQGVEVLIPIHQQERLMGYVFVGPKASGEPYDAGDLEFLTTLVSQAAISLENARLFQETLEKQRMEEELHLARTIQKQLFPRELPALPGYELFGYNRPSHQVGGDYYDVIPITPRQVAVAIGDVSGKGVPASLLMANLQSALRVMMAGTVPLTEVVQRLNRLIHQNTSMDKFITFFIGILDTERHTFQYVNAGHNPPYRVSDNGEIYPLEAGGLLLGVVPEAEYQSETISLAPGEVIFAYTDGVNEALNAQGEEFGDERLKQLLQKLVGHSVEAMSTRLLEAIDAFVGEEFQADDITLLALRRVGDDAPARGRGE